VVAPETGRPRADERKLVTILFADLVGSTSLGEQLDPERLQVLLATYFGAMARIIEGWGGTVEKYIGDAIMAVFGVPAVHEDDAQRAVGAALDMVTTLETLNRQFRERHGVEIQIRIGVSTGDVVVPLGGPPGQMIVTGDAVNTAARLEQATEPGAILIGERTHEAARNGRRTFRASFGWHRPSIGRGRCERARGDLDSACRGFEQALAAYERLAMPIETAQVREQLAGLSEHHFGP
jgi:class 3 adenylate cyclase